jgi:Icc-related predicted phosphoesterase
MSILVIGDLHLGVDQQRPKIHSEWSAYDAVFLVGDIVDAGNRTRSLPASVYSDLNALGIPIVSVPGNHDFRKHESRIKEYEEIVCVHNRCVCKSGYIIGGLGSTQYDEGPEIRGEPLQHRSSEELIDTIIHLEGSAEIIEDSVLSGSVTEKERQWYNERLESLRSLRLQSNDSPQILMTHIPPFGSPGAYLESHPRGSRPVSWGSLAVRQYIEETDIDLHLCGHIHEQSGPHTIAGVISLNAGYRKAFEVNFSAQDEMEISSIELEWSEHKERS